MSDSPNTALPAAAKVQVRDADGATLVGWIVRSDVVVVQGAGLESPITAERGGEWVEAEETFAAEGAAPASTGDSDWTALQFAEGTFPVEGEYFPPGIEPEPADPLKLQARRAFWCIMFPHIRGC